MKNGGTRLTVADYLAQDRLTDAATQAATAVKTDPMDVQARLLLAELLCLQGALERADSHLQIASQQAPNHALAIAQWRGLLRAELARLDWAKKGALPNYVAPPTPAQQCVMKLALAVRATDAAEAAALLKALEGMHVPLRGRCDGSDFDDFRDVDDLSQHNVEILSSDGRYFWIAPESLERIILSPPKRPRDLLWRHARALFRDGARADIHVPAQYIDDHSEDEHRLVRRTEWIETVGGVVCGRGQRTYLIGEEARGIMDINALSFAASM
jgi:type VI secretion system protein ImpE